MIKYGSIEYFSLLELKKNLGGQSLNKLDLQYLDKLRLEVDQKIKVSDLEYNERIKVPSLAK